MTVDELRAEAKKLGYNIIPKQKYIPVSPCKCGRKRVEHWYGYERGKSSVFYKCPSCGRCSTDGETEREARINWNRMMEEETDSLERTGQNGKT